MESPGWEAARSTFNYSFDIRINLLKDDEKVSRFKTMKLRHSNQKFKFRFLVTVFPNGVDESNEGWLVVLADVRVPKNEPRPRDYGILSCTVSVVDIEGNSRLPRSFVEIPSEEDDRYPKYLERSVILNRKEEFLSGTLLTLRCDIHFYLNTVFREGLIHRILKDFLRPIPHEFCYKHEAQTGDRCDISKEDPCNISKGDPSDISKGDPSDISKEDPCNISKGDPSDISKGDPCDISNGDPCDISKGDSSDISKGDPNDIFTVFDFTSLILTLPQSHESRKRFVVYGNPTSFSSDSKNDNTDILEHVWIFDTVTVRFLLSLDERQDSVGVRLLKASAVIRRCVHTPMKERREKRIEFPNTTSRTFIIVLFFLEKGMLPASENRDFLDVYKFSHLYEMLLLQRKCADAMVKILAFTTEELKRIADKYSDGYLSKQLESRRLDYEHLEQPRLKMNDRPDSDCYI